jgi:hypothetical protein
MGPAERVRLAQRPDDEDHSSEAVKRRVIDTLVHGLK